MKSKAHQSKLIRTFKDLSLQQWLDWIKDDRFIKRLIHLKSGLQSHFSTREDIRCFKSEGILILELELSLF